VAAVGCGDLVVGITHECDHPEHLISKQLPVVTSSSIDSSKTSKEIDDQVSSSLLTDATMYKLDKELITRLDPNVILTQSLCDVCAVSTRECSRVLADRDDYRLVSIEPSTLEDVRNSIRIVGSELGAKEESIQGTLNNFDETREMIRAKVADKVGSKGGVLPTVAFLEWLDPLYNGGHWISEMMVDAGVDYTFSKPGERSRKMSPEEVVAADPDYVICSPCGFDLQRASEEARALHRNQKWFRDLRAVREGRVYAADGNQFFSRPSPRLVCGIGILASIAHQIEDPCVPEGSWCKIDLNAKDI